MSRMAIHRLLLTLPILASAARCPPCGDDGQMACPPTGRAAGESCGGPCDRDGLCAPGLTCAPVDTLKTRVLEFFAPDARSGVCTTREPLAPACVGCPSPAPPDDEGIIDAARWAVATVNAGRNNAHALELVRIASASKQVVAGEARPHATTRASRTPADQCARARARARMRRHQVHAHDRGGRVKLRKRRPAARSGRVPVARRHADAAPRRRGARHARTLVHSPRSSWRCTCAGLTSAWRAPFARGLRPPRDRARRWLTRRGEHRDTCCSPRRCGMRTADV